MLNLPTDMLHKICDQLSTGDLIAVAGTNRQLREIALDPQRVADRLHRGLGLEVAAVVAALAPHPPSAGIELLARQAAAGRRLRGRVEWTTRQRRLRPKHENGRALSLSASLDAVVDTSGAWGQGVWARRPWGSNSDWVLVAGRKRLGRCGVGDRWVGAGGRCILLEDRPSPTYRLTLGSGATSARPQQVSRSGIGVAGVAGAGRGLVVAEPYGGLDWHRADDTVVALDDAPVPASCLAIDERAGRWAVAGFEAGRVCRYALEDALGSGNPCRSAAVLTGEAVVSVGADAGGHILWALTVDRDAFDRCFHEPHRPASGSRLSLWVATGGSEPLRPVADWSQLFGAPPSNGWSAPQISADGRRAAALDAHGALCLVEFERTEWPGLSPTALRLKSPSDLVYTNLSVHPSGHFVLAHADDGASELWDLTSPTPGVSRRWSGGFATASQFALDGLTLATRIGATSLTLHRLDAGDGPRG